jgi:hypothetical protein
VLLKSSAFINVTHSETGEAWPEMLEGRFLLEFFCALQSHDPGLFQSLRFLIMNKNSRFGALHPPFSGQDVVLIWLSDEEASIPPEDFSRNFRLILKSYWPLGEGVRNVLPFPLCGASEVVRTQPLPWDQRKTEVFFTGNLNANRVDFFRQFNHLRNLPPWDLPFYWQKRLYWEAILRSPIPLHRDFSDRFPDSLIAFTHAFKAGMTPAAYAQSLATSKIAICPPGFTSAETIRHFEAMRLGCVIVSPPLPHNPFYAGSPIVVLKNWRSLGQCLSKLLREDGKALQERADATFQWWQSRASPAGMANIVLQRLRSSYFTKTF